MPKSFASLIQVSQLTGELIFTHLKTAYKNAVENIKVLLRYYTNKQFIYCEIWLWLLYAFCNPYRVSKNYLIKQRAENIHAYGETYLTTLHQIALKCRILSSDKVYELGCGRGRTLFWLAAFVRCTVIGVEQIPLFVTRAKKIAQKAQLKNAYFIEADILTTDFSDATVIYFYGTSFSDQFIKQLLEKFKMLKKGTKIISVSFPLADYCKENSFEIIDQFSGAFPWGEAEIYLQQKNI